MKHYLERWAKHLLPDNRLNFIDRKKQLKEFEKEHFYSIKEKLKPVLAMHFLAIENVEQIFIGGVSQNFGQHLKQTSLNFSMNISEFFKSTVKDNDSIFCFDFGEKIEGYSGCVVQIGRTESNPDSVKVAVSATDFENGLSTFNINELEPGKPLVDYSEYEHKDVASVMEYAIKLSIYIKTANPDLQNIPAFSRARVLGRKKKIVEVNPFDVQRIGYGFHKRTFHKDSSVVSGHYRWQPYGTNLSKVKLIWIKEHQRSYGT